MAKPFNLHSLAVRFLAMMTFVLLWKAQKTITYMLKIYTNFDQQCSRHVAGTLEYPLTKAESIKNMLEALKF